MLNIRWGWCALAAAVALPFSHYGLSDHTASASGLPIAPMAARPVARQAEAKAGPDTGCSGSVLANPFGRDGARCGGDVQPQSAGVRPDPAALRRELDRVTPCKGRQTMNDLTADCIEQNAGAAAAVRKLEALVEQGDAYASGELARVVERERKENTSTGEYRDELERGEAVLLRIAASGGMEAERKIVRPQAQPADGQLRDAMSR